MVQNRCAMECPRCHQPDVAGETCPRCGVIVSKALALDRRRWGREEAAPLPPDAAPTWPYWLLAAVFLTIGGVAWLRPRVGATVPPEMVVVRTHDAPAAVPKPSAPVV